MVDLPSFVAQPVVEKPSQRISPVVCILGRPNVGKSSLFNRILGRRRALVDATPGLTRDRLYGDIQWRGLAFRLVDTGGLQFNRANRLTTLMQTQVEHALEESSLGLLVCDAKEGLVPLDKEVASWARGWGRPILPVVNKTEMDRDRQQMYEFSMLGFGEPLGVSSLHGLGIGELLDAIVERLKGASRMNSIDTSSPKEQVLKVAIIGRPNVGKSSLINRILNEERVLVDDAPGTTRDPVEISFHYGGRFFCLIDTAGVRSRRRLKAKIDAVARLKAFESAQEADVCVGVLDGSTGIVQDDLKLFGRIVKSSKPLCLAVNKWDLVKEPIGPKEAAEAIAKRAPFLRWAPLVVTSAKTNLNVLSILDKALQVAQQARRQLLPKEGKSLLQKIQADPKAPVAIRHTKWFRLTQAAGAVPVFHLLCRSRRPLKKSDIAYLERKIRQELHLTGTPVQIRLLSLAREKNS